MNRALLTTALVVLPSVAALAAPAPDATPGTVVDVAARDGRFSTLIAAAKAAGLVETLSGPGPLTVLAPTDDAFRALPAGTVETLLKPENRAQLAAILSYHVFPGRIDAAAFARGTGYATVLGPTLSARFEAGRLFLGAAPVLATDITASNGVVHVIGAVLLPPATPTSRADRVQALVARALDVGVPLYNGGNPAACAAAYELAARGVADLGEDVVPADVRAELLRAADMTGSPADRAWALRHALDQVRALATPTMRPVAMPAPARPTIAASPAAAPAPAAAGAPVDRAVLVALLDRAVAALDAGDAAGAQAGVADAARRLGGDSHMGARLTQAAARSDASAMRRLVVEIRDDLAFEPRREAEAPAGWPAPTIVGEVELKRYPTYRMAKADGAGNAAFWTLFRHIKANDIAMTAPVQMDDERTDGRASGSMAFLYGSLETGRPGRDGAVEVVDVPPTVAASIGVRGPLSREAMDEARAALEGWLARHPAWSAAAPIRRMGWNSPFVARDAQFHEVQLPLTPTRSAGAR